MAKITTSLKEVIVDDSGRETQIAFEGASPVEAVEKMVALSVEAPITIAMICNTVANARKMEALISANLDADVFLFHSRFVSIDRLQNDAFILDQLGKHAPRPQRTQIYVTTQIIEQSLDIDFDVIFSELAPMEALLQRAGRLQRHKSKNAYRPNAVSDARFFLVGWDDENLKSFGSQMIYSEYRLEQAQRTLNALDGSPITLPTDITSLIEKAHGYCAENMNIMKTKWANDSARRKTNAEKYMIAEVVSCRNKPIFGWLVGGVLDVHEAKLTEAKAIATVRDGISGPSVILIWKDPEGGYKIPHYTNNVREWRKIDLEDYSISQSHAIMGSSITLPRGLSGEGTIDALKIKAADDPSILKAWAEMPFLKGEIPLVLDSEGCTVFLKKQIYYTTEKGFALDEL